MKNTKWKEKHKLKKNYNAEKLKGRGSVWNSLVSYVPRTRQLPRGSLVPVRNTTGTKGESSILILQAQLRNWD
jgi:hypothetical protein